MDTVQITALVGAAASLLCNLVVGAGIIMYSGLSRFDLPLLHPLPKGRPRACAALLGGNSFLGLGVAALRVGLTGADTGLTLSLIQRLLDQPQHELPLGELAARAGSLALQVRFDTLEEVLVNLKGEGAGFVVGHGYVTSVFFHFVVFEYQVGDVLRGGQARFLSGLRDFLM